ncbi:MAG: nuclear transport factor 2 family protein [Pyrinomonadaceae bacterium]
MDNKDLITKFYTSFAKGEAEEMISCYHEDIEFSDPAFGVLHSDDAKDMWRMLIKRAKGNLEIDFKNVSANGDKGWADWTARYLFSKTGRNVFNEIHAEFEFREGKIIVHRDNFDIWKWSKQALGLPGHFLGWSSFMQNKIRNNARESLSQFTGKDLA